MWSDFKLSLFIHLLWILQVGYYRSVITRVVNTSPGPGPAAVIDDFGQSNEKQRHEYLQSVIIYMLGQKVLIWWKEWMSLLTHNGNKILSALILPLGTHTGPQGACGWHYNFSQSEWVYTLACVDIMVTAYLLFTVCLVPSWFSWQCSLLMI